eukprot:5465360-Prymnesium_polylepis.1
MLKPISPVTAAATRMARAGGQSGAGAVDDARDATPVNRAQTKQTARFESQRAVPCAHGW